MKRYTLLFLSCFAIVGTVLAQDNKNSIEVSPFTALKAFSAEGNTLGGPLYGLEGVYHINMANNQADWVRGLNINDVSIALSYRDFSHVYLTKKPGSQGVLGNYYGAVSRISIVLLNVGKTKFMATPGFGFGYAGETYYTNDNTLVGSHINFTAQIGFKFLTPLSASTQLVGGIDLYHYSNAAFKNPNDGINSINASVGIAHDINVEAPPTAKKQFKHYGKNSFELGVGLGRRGLVQTGGGLDPVGYPLNVAYQKTASSDLYQSGLYLGYNYRLNHVLALKAGFDAVYYYKTLDTIPEVHHFYATYQELGSSYDRLRVGASLGFETWLGKFSMPINIGHYIHYHYFVPTYQTGYSPPDFYWSFGVRYYCTPWLALEAKQYLHRTQADYANFGLVFRVGEH